MTFFFRLSKPQLSGISVKKQELINSYEIEKYLKLVVQHTIKKQRLKITQLEKVCFIKVNDLKLMQVEIF